jgi:hypothetical protein
MSDRSPKTVTRLGLALAAIMALIGPSAGHADPVWVASDPQTSADPVAAAVAENEAQCSGTASVQEGFLRTAEVDGDGVNDLILDYGRLRCDGLTGYCGSAGCRQDIWLFDPEVGWRLVLRDLVNEIFVPLPGSVVTRLNSGYCDTPRVCFRAYDAWGGTLRVLEPGPEVGPEPF